MSEFDLHRSTVRKLKRLGLLFTHPPNGGKRRPTEAIRLAAMGVQAGVPDLLIFTAPPSLPGVRGVAIELKVPHGRLSVGQQQWLDALSACRWLVSVCRTEAEVDHLLCVCGWSAGSAASAPVAVGVDRAEAGGAAPVVDEHQPTLAA